MIILDDFKKNMITEYEKKSFHFIKEYIQQEFPDQSFLFTLESWNKNKDGMKYVKEKEDIDFNHYETWISVYPMHHDCYISIDHQTQVLSACSCLLDVYSDDDKKVLKMNEQCSHQLYLQIEEIIDDIKEENTELIISYKDDEFCQNSKFVFLY